MSTTGPASPSSPYALSVTPGLLWTSRDGVSIGPSPNASSTWPCHRRTRSICSWKVHHPPEPSIGQQGSRAATASPHRAHAVLESYGVVPRNRDSWAQNGFSLLLNCGEVFGFFSGNVPWRKAFGRVDLGGQPPRSTRPTKP